MCLATMRSFATMFATLFVRLCVSYVTQYWRIKETARRISDCDKNVCCWAFEERVPLQIQLLEGVKPDANTVIRIALSNGQQIHTAWNDTAAANPSERDWWDH